MVRTAETEKKEELGRRRFGGLKGIGKVVSEALIESAFEAPNSDDVHRCVTGTDGAK